MIGAGAALGLVISSRDLRLKINIAAVQNDLVLVVLRGRRLAVVRNQKPGSASKVFIGVDVAQKPVLLLHVVAGFRVGIQWL